MTVRSSTRAALASLGVALLLPQLCACDANGVLSRSSIKPDSSYTISSPTTSSSDSLDDANPPSVDADSDDSSSSHLLAVLLACASAVFNGSFAALQKLDSVAKCDLHPVLFMLYNCTGVFLSSWLAIPFLPALSRLPPTSIFRAGNDVWEFTPLGLAAGSLYVLAIFFSFSAVPRVGVSIGQGNTPLSLLSVCLVCLGLPSTS